jgi:Dyp-type peroxidase family
MVVADFKLTQTRSPEPVLSLYEIQGNSLAGFKKDEEMLLFLSITDAALAKTWLAQIAPHIATMAEVMQFNRLFKQAKARRYGREGTVKSTFINIGLSFQGLKKLTPEAEAFTDEAFKAGLASRSAQLGDPTDPAQAGHPSQWVIGGPNNEPDVVLIVASDEASDLDSEVKWLLSTLPVGGVKLMFQQRGASLPGDLKGHEHFGFKDGISQPGIRGQLSEREGDFFTPSEDPAEPKQGKPGQDLLHAGEFIFGYPTQIGHPDRDEFGNEIEGLNIKPGPIAEAGPGWAVNGSYLVFRRLRQDVPGFHAFLQSTAQTLAGLPQFVGMTPARLGAKLVGRWPSGAPVVKAPNEDNPALTDDLDFEFEDEDGQGFVCPFAGHIRKTYPRDTKRGDFVNESATQTRRLLRRGIPYGPVFANGLANGLANGFVNILAAEENGLATEGSRCPMRSLGSAAGVKALVQRSVKAGMLAISNAASSAASSFTSSAASRSADPSDGDRGLLFMAYQTSITRQFEFVSQVWVNNPDFSDPAAGHDPVLGQNAGSDTRERTMALQSPQGEVQIALPQDWVIPTGGGYFFTPSISALQHLAESA